VVVETHLRLAVGARLVGVVELEALMPFPPGALPCRQAHGAAIDGALTTSRVGASGPLGVLPERYNVLGHASHE